LPVPVHQHQVTEFLSDGMFLSGPQESKPGHEDNGSAKTDVAVEGDSDLAGFYPSAPGDFDNIPPGNSNFPHIVGDQQAVGIDGNLLKPDVIPVDAHYHEYADRS